MSFANCILVGSVVFWIIFCNSVPEETATSFAATKLLLLNINDKRVEYNNIFFLLNLLLGSLITKT